MSNSNTPLFDWESIFAQIPESQCPSSLIPLIKSCMEDQDAVDIYDSTDKKLNQAIENLKKLFQEKTEAR